MAQMTSYAPGTPNWVDVASPNIDTSVAFYRDLFGWEATDLASGDADADTGGYQMFGLRGHVVAGIGPVQDGGGPPAWCTYFASTDADATADAIRDAGGTVTMEPFSIFDAGRMLLAADPAGAAFGVWQARDHIGAGLVNEPGTLSWNELNTRDPDAAFPFWTEVFGWEARTHGTGGTAYTEFLLDGRPVAGGVDMRGQVPAEIPDHWLTYFAVEDTDATVTRVEELGGQVMVPPTDIPPGRFAVVAEADGAHFAVIALQASG